MRKRIVRLTVTLAAVTIAIFGIPLAVGLARYLINDQYAALERVAGAAAIEVSGDLTAIPTSPPGFNPDTRISVYDASGAPVQGEVTGGEPLIAAALTGAGASGVVDARVGAAAPITDGDSIVGAVLVTTSRSTVFVEIGLIWLSMLTLAGAALGVVWLLARRQAGRLVDPLRALTLAAERLGGGDFTVRTEPAGIAEIDSVNASMNRTAGRLGDLVARERAFSADASHQLRTPLTGLRLQLEAALDRPDADLRAAIGDALITTDRLTTTITELLALARDPARPADILDVPALVDGIRRRWHADLAARGRPLRVSVDGQPQVRVSVSALDQILDVLIDNADRHGAGAITVRIRATAGAVAFEVADDGRAVPADAAAALVSSTTQLEDGHGIGLNLARRLAEGQGGRLNLSRIDPPTFTVLIPAQPADLPQAESSGNRT